MFIELHTISRSSHFKIILTVIVGLESLFLQGYKHFIMLALFTVSIPNLDQQCWHSPPHQTVATKRILV